MPKPFATLHGPAGMEALCRVAELPALPFRSAFPTVKVSIPCTMVIVISIAVSVSKGATSGVLGGRAPQPVRLGFAFLLRLATSSVPPSFEPAIRLLRETATARLQHLR